MRIVYQTYQSDNPDPESRMLSGRNRMTALLLILYSS